MSRALLDYTARGQGPSVPYVGFDPDVPIPGTYRVKLRSGAVYVGVKIWHGAPLDPIDGTELDRAPCWNATVNGKSIDLTRVWPKCADEPISIEEHDYIVSVAEWAKAHAPHHPAANPNKPIDLLTAPLPAI